MTSCRQPGCTGTIEDGYCDLCGHAESAAPPPVAASSSSPAGDSPHTRPVSRPMTSPVSSGRSRAGVLAELADLPSVPYRDPASAIMADPQVAEEKRFCANPACGKPVGRSRQGRPGLPDGFCPHCRTQFSFTPKLGKDELVAGQYRVLGCLAHGGLGWIYLAADENLDGRWVVLKGLLNTADAEALAAAEAERRFLTTVDHPNIVKIFNFQRSAGLGYIVMEYVGGQSLHELRRKGPLPLREALMYGREVLRAFGYLHEQGLVYCDLKPANVIRVGKRLKLIDLGAVQRLGSPPGTSWATVGYHAPELDTHPSSVPSDLYTVARTLAVLAIPSFSPAKGGVPAPLPDDCGNESFARLLRRATAADPNARFQSAEEMEAQLVGVLREVSAIADGVPYPAHSPLFGPERVAAGAALSADQRTIFDPLDPREAAEALPVPLADPADPAAGALAGLVGHEPEELVAQVAAMARTPETLLTRARLLAEQGSDQAVQALDEAERTLPGDWRVTWYRGVLALAQGQAARAVPLFDACVSLLPGELAAKLALAFALECSGQNPVRWYETVWRTDHGHVSAAFGLARAGRVAVLDEVPATSSHRIAAQLALVASVARQPRPDTVRPEQLTAAADRLERLPDLAPRRRESMTAELLQTALAWLDTAGSPPAGLKVAGAAFTEPGVRRRLEGIFRKLAVAADSRHERHALIDQANAVRPRTWL
ncbi:serine/threonine-protein kinase [Nonomuraea cavernae]|uniref:non-specific serine/threonine protein kinase n=1 Tax=Nonomuraea cavernae TaxID=2045107 RepID=A0A917YTF1_9ACTN|nr:serine/threonine-protein kinase [Nonomuraea cavernae]MCA2185443.1 serine/threonine-protein kinase PknG [Nonomuraea cavernae]GGO66489.1 putative serine/threonine-protein kinase [Nonomuraea cavernae]